MRSCAIAFGALSLALAAAPACAPRSAPPSTPPSLPEAVTDGDEGMAAAEVRSPPEPLPAVALAPLWETVARPEEGFAGLAVWPGAVRAWLVVAAAASHRLVLFDAESGELLREVGSLGERAGSFREPVAVAVGGDLAFVVERGNARVQVLRLPGLATVGFLGEGELVRPEAVAVEPAGEGWTVWVGEEEVGGPGATGGADAGGSRATVHRFEVAADGSALAGRRLELGLSAVPGGRLVALALGRGERAPGAAGGAPGGATGESALDVVGEPALGVAGEPVPDVIGEPALDAGPALAAIASGGGEVVGYAFPAGLSGRPLDVLAGVVSGAGALPCGAGGGWVVALEHGGLLAFSAEPPIAASSLAVEGVTAPVAVAVAGRPLAEPPAGTLYVLTADSRVVALAGGELAALAPSICP